MILKDTIFGFFTDYDKISDTYKDLSGKGLLERYNEAMGDQADEDLLPLVDNLVNTLLSVKLCEEKFLLYLEGRTGSRSLVSGSYIVEEIRRAMLSKIISWYKIKGTKKLLLILLNMIGIDATITEEFNTYGFDSAVTFDDPLRVFDQSCGECVGYTLDFTGPPVLDPAQFVVMMGIMRFNDPIDTYLRTGTYNGSEIVAQNVQVLPDGLGGLAYSNPYDPYLVIELIGGVYVVTGGYMRYYTQIAPDVFLFSIGAVISIGSFDDSWSTSFSG